MNNIQMNNVQFWNTAEIESIAQFRIHQNKDLLDSLYEAVEVADIRAGVIVSGIGALTKAVCRNLRWFPEEYPVKDADRLFFELQQPLELLALSGWIARRLDGEPEIHAHFSVSTVEGNKIVNFGGHLASGTMTGIKVVVAIAKLRNTQIKADFDPDTKTFDLFL
jgi:predicted DNA-binding protein with PD1-like motif